MKTAPGTMKKITLSREGQAIEGQYAQGLLGKVLTPQTEVYLISPEEGKGEVDLEDLLPGTRWKDNKGHIWTVGKNKEKGQKAADKIEKKADRPFEADPRKEQRNNVLKGYKRLGPRAREIITEVLKLNRHFGGHIDIEEIKALPGLQLTALRTRNGWIMLRIEDEEIRIAGALRPDLQRGVEFSGKGTITIRKGSWPEAKAAIEAPAAPPQAAEPPQAAT